MLQPFWQARGRARVSRTEALPLAEVLVPKGTVICRFTGGPRIRTLSTMLPRTEGRSIWHCSLGAQARRWRLIGDRIMVGVCKRANMALGLPILLQVWSVMKAADRRTQGTVSMKRHFDAWRYVLKCEAGDVGITRSWQTRGIRATGRRRLGCTDSTWYLCHSLLGKSSVSLFHRIMFSFSSLIFLFLCPPPSPPSPSSPPS